MRLTALLPLTAFLVLACGSEKIQQPARSVPQRDLTLVTPAAEVTFASPVETQQHRPERRTAHSAHSAARFAAQRLSPSKPREKLADEWVPAPSLAVPQPAVQPAKTVTPPSDDRELLPGRTVTVIPASNGPPAVGDGNDPLPRVRGHARAGHGGETCGGRGRGSGPAPAPRPDFR